MQFFSRMKSNLKVLFIPALLAALAMPLSLDAQDVAVGQATANVLTILTVTATQDLDFGNVLQGVPKAQPRNDDDSSGIFTITGAEGREASMHLQLPDYLWNSTGQDRMVIAFGTTDAAIDSSAAGTPGTPGGGAQINLDPHSLPDFGIGNMSLRVYLGGTVYPTADQRASAYSADIILTVAYTGS